MHAMRFIVLLPLTLWGLAGVPAMALDYPTKPVRIIVPFTAGGAGDVAARALGTELQPTWKQPIIVENRLGAGGLIGYEAVARAVPDGHTLLQAHSAFPIYHLVTKKENLRFDPMKDLVLVAMFGENLNLMATNTAVPAANFKEFLAYAKANPGKLNYASLGPTSFLALATEAFKYMTGTTFAEIAYKGSPEGIAGLVRNDIQLIYNPYQTLKPFMDQGTVRPLFVIWKTRVPELPNVPTNAEVGLEQFTPRVWQGIAAPAATPKDVVSKINADVGAIVARLEYRNTLKNLSMAPLTLSVPEMQAFLEEDLARWTSVVRNANIQPQ